MTHIRPTQGAPKSECDLCIIGGGVMGLSIAYQLARLGFANIVIVERGYLAEGASGRNGGGVRMQWSSENNIRLMQESIDLCRSFAGELGVNNWFRAGGYLFLARSNEERAQMERNIELQNRCGVPTRLIGPDEVRSIVPRLNTDGILCGAYNAKDGTVFPWPFLWGYAERAMERGVTLHLHTPVTQIDRDSERYVVHTPRGNIRTPRVLNAAGAWSPEIARMLGITLPNSPHRHEILSTESLKPFLDPMVCLLSSGLYFSQSMRGEIVTGISMPDADDGTVKLGSRLAFTQTIAREITALMPQFASLKVVRQWAGPYDVTPDGHPIVGEVASHPGFYLACGFVGYGFMMAPIVGKLYADYLTGRSQHIMFTDYNVDRFARGNLQPEEMLLG